jgi:glycosyltransferase involved in cell wall biosynthesis
VKISLVHYRYFVSSGPERYMFSLTDLLEKLGHEVVPFSVRYRQNEPTPWARHFVPPIAGDDEITFRQHSWSPASVRRALERAFYSREVYDALSRQLDEARPDVALVLCYIRKMSPAVLAALHDHGVPIVVRFSDFAMVCPQPHMIRDDRVCELCVRRGLWPSVRHRCVQGSLGASAINAAAMWWGRRRGYFDLVDAFVCPSDIMRRKMIEGGLPAAKLHHLPTFVRPQEPRPFAERRRRICFVGRVQTIKGLDTLLDALEIVQRRGAAGELETVIAGDAATPAGEALRARLAAHPIPGVTLAGQLGEDEVLGLLQSSMLSVVPSLWYENTPNALLESLACGTPVIASDLGSLQEMLAGTGAGLLFPPGDAVALAAALETAFTETDLEDMGRRAHALALGRHSPDAHLTALLDLFAALRADR